MPIHGYPGGVISATAPTVSPSSATGVWTLEQQLQNSANWPSQSNIARSLRFNSADSAYLNRTPASAGNRKTWTWSGWLKRSSLGSSQYFMSAYTASTDAGFFGCRFTNFDVVSITGGTTEWLGTTQVFRDVSGWYHFVIAVDTTQATANNRVRFYVNGSEVTTFTTRNNPTQNDDLGYNGNWSHTISSNTVTPNQFFNGYLADVYFIDGQALTPSSFGYFDSNGIWQPNSYTGSYGTNGFWLNFDDNSGTTATTLGKDSSGNGNNWTPNNFSVTAGAGNDSLVDSPTNYGTDTGVGGEVRGNYCTLNPLDLGFGIALANGNLDVTNPNSTHRLVRGTFAFPASGKWYAEIRVGETTSSGSALGFGFGTNAAVLNSYNATGQYLLYASSAREIANNTAAISLTGGAFTAGDILQIAIDIDGSKVWFGINNVWYNSAGGTTGDPAAGTNATIAVNASGMLPLCDVFNGTTAHSANFGQRPFAYTAPAGFKALCSTNLTTPTIQNGSLYFGPSLFSKSAGVSPTVTNAGFQPDFVWIKSRSVSENHYAVDSVRGTSSLLRPNLTDAQLTSQVWLTFNSDGFSPAATGFLTDSATYVGWQWKGGGTGVSNTAGSIASTVSANQTSGFSIVTYTGTGANATVGHGLGVAPSMVIVKKRSSATSSGWAVYHISTGATKYLQLQDVDAANTVSTMWNNTAPTSSVFTIGTDAWVNASSQTNVAYCFAPVSGYSAFGSYTGNASDNGPFIYLGFKAAFILVKRTSTGGEGWWIYDNKRSPYNIANVILSPNLSGAEISGGTYPIDINSNGFKIRGINALLNSNNDTYIYMAFAENPFKIARAR